MLERSYYLHRVPRDALLALLGTLTLIAGLVMTRPAAAQDIAAAAEESTLFSPEELEELVGPVALYPDDLVGIILPASTYPLDVVQAARFLDEYENDSSLQPDEDWDDSVVALLNYPEVLRLMDEDLEWTWDLGEAFLTQQADVLDAVQRYREQAREAGNLASNERQVVREEDGAIRIAPADPKVIYVPYYEPYRVIVHHHEPIYYYPRPYPVYYYPYPANYSFHAGFFWGVTSAFVVGWNSHFLHVHHHAHHAHPYYNRYSHGFYDPFYVRRAVNLNVVNVNRAGYVWQPNYRAGGRPNRVSVTRYEGQARRQYDTRTYNTRSYGTRSYEGPRNSRSSAGVATRRSDAAANRVQRRGEDQRAVTGTTRSIERLQGERARSRASSERGANSRTTHGIGNGAARATPRDTAGLSPYAARNPRVAESVRQRAAATGGVRQSAAARQSSPGARAPSARTTARMPATRAPSARAPSTRAPSSIATSSRGPRATGTAPAARSAPIVRAPAARSAPRSAPATRARSGSVSRSATRAFGGGQRR